jgi:hypothetical protein
VARDLSRSDVKDVKEEESLLVEAVSLLVQRQREAESWVAEQMWQAEERAAATERHYADLEARLGAIEDQLNRLVRDVEPARSGGGDERLARLREQVEGLKTENDGRPVAREPELSRPRSAAPPVAPPVVATPPEPVPNSSTERSIPPVATPEKVRQAQGQAPGLLEMIGSTPQDRFGVGLIALGAVAVLYAVLSQLPIR